MSNRAFSKKTLTLLLTVFILQIFFIFSFPAASFARGEEGLSKPKLKLNVPIPGTAYDKPGKEYSIDIADYIGVIYQYSLSIVTIIAVLMIMIAGVTWLMAGGSPEKVTTAKNMIGGAVIGLLLMLFSYLLLNTINPRLTKLEVPEIRGVAQVPAICCEDEQGEAELVYANECPDNKKKVNKRKCGAIPFVPVNEYNCGESIKYVFKGKTYTTCGTGGTGRGCPPDYFCTTNINPAYFSDKRLFTNIKRCNLTAPNREPRTLYYACQNTKVSKEPTTTTAPRPSTETKHQRFFAPAQ